MRSLRGLLFLSLGLAGFAFVFPGFYNPSPHLGTAVNASYMMSGIWGLLVLYGFLRIGRRAGWLLMGVPLSLAWPALTLWLYFACKVSKDCI